MNKERWALDKKGNFDFEENDEEESCIQFDIRYSLLDIQY
jgi:hypothetical protein